MAMGASCPHCGARFTVNDSVAGQKIRCRECEEPFVVKQSGRAADSDRDDDGIQEKSRTRPLASATAPPGRTRYREDDDSDNHRFRRRPERSSSTGLILGLVGGGIALVAVIGVVIVIAMTQSDSGAKPDAGGIPIGQVPNIQQDFNNPFQEKPFPNNPIPRGGTPAQEILRLKSGNVFEQKDASDSLARMKPEALMRPKVVEALKALINDRTPLVPRNAAVKALAVWGTALEVPYLIGLLDDQDGGVKEEAITALGKMKDARAADALSLKLADFFQRGRASQALKDIGSAAEKAVLTQLQHPDGGVRAEACRILKVIGTKNSYPSLLQATNDPDGMVAQAAREALPPAERPPQYGPQQTMTLNVHVVNIKAWPALEARIKALADSPKVSLKVRTSGDYKWVDIAPVMSDAETFARRINFAKIVAIHNDQRLIYLDSGQ
jgi:predicted Zn finger-like uncharacterized protein